MKNMTFIGKFIVTETSPVYKIHKSNCKYNMIFLSDF